MSTVLPRLTLMDDAQIAKIHEASLKILSTTGIRVSSERARALFEKACGTNAVDEKVLITPDVVEWALGACPAEVTVFNRKKEKAFTLGGSDNRFTRFGTGVTNLHYQEPDTDQVVSFRREHVSLTTRLADRLASFDVVSTPGVPSDLADDKMDAVTVLEMAANTAKPLVVLVSEARRFVEVLSLLNHLFLDLKSFPFVIPYLNPVTPLVLNDETVEKLWQSVQAGLPVIYSNYSMYGATTPMTPAGSLSLLIAELLAGIALSQLMKEGTPVIAGSLPAGFEMTSMASVYTPASMLMNLCSAEMMDHYGVPHCGTSGSGTGWGPDVLAAGTQWMNHITSCIGKVGLAPFVGGNFDSLAFSPALVVYADQVIKDARAFARGFVLDDAALVADEIHRAGPGGNFLTSESTLGELFGNPPGAPLWPPLTLKSWQEQGCPRADELLRKRTCEILESLDPPDDCEEIVQKGEEWIEKSAE